jgi:predicted TIM-barrel fold metal-dependent hydrolase
MAIDEHLVIDAVVHAFDNRPENCRVRYAEQHNEGNFQVQEAWMPEQFRMTREEYFVAHDASTMLSMLFRESATDVACFHSIPAWGVWRDNSPMSVGLEMRRRAPGRVFCYGAVSPAEGPKALEDLERQVEEWGPISGVKLYPFDFVDGVYQGLSLADEQHAYPLLQKCLDLGVNTVAIHKAIPLAGMPMDPARVGDIDYAARDFPDLNFEVVHAGFAFLEESAFQLARFPNVYANLEACSALILPQPRVFASIIGQLLFYGGAERIMWGTGGMAFHPHPLVEAFASFEMPADLVKDYGYPELTDEIRANIFGRNWARMQGLDPDELLDAVSDDEYADGDVAPPWSVIRGSAVGA